MKDGPSLALTPNNVKQRASFAASTFPEVAARASVIGVNIPNENEAPPGTVGSNFQFPERRPSVMGESILFPDGDRRQSSVSGHFPFLDSSGRPSIVSGYFPFFERGGRPSIVSSISHLSSEHSLVPSISHSIYSAFSTFSHSKEEVLLPPQPKAALAIFGECLDQLHILKRLYRNVVEEEPTDQLKYKTLAERFGQSGRNFDSYKLNFVTSDYQKLLRQVNTLIEVISLVCGEIEETGTFTELTGYLEIAAKMKKDESTLVRDLKRKERKVALLRRAATNEKRKNDATLDALYQEINNLKTEYETLAAYYEQEQNYLEKWEKSRREQNFMILEGKEEEHLSVIRNMEKSVHEENTCHAEIAAFFEEMRQDYLKQIQEWMERYEHEVEEKDNEIFQMKGQIDTLTEEKEKLQDLYDGRSKEIEEYLEVKRIRREKEEREALENWAATKIQAWWRGTMYRKKLGPWRPKKKKGKGKDKKGKGNKGKKKK